MKFKKLLFLTTLTSLIALLVSCASYVGGTNASAARKFISALDRGASHTRIALNTVHSLVLTNVIKPEDGISLTEALQKFNAANAVLYKFAGANIVFDEKGNGVLLLTPTTQAEAERLIDSLNAAAIAVLDEEVLTSSVSNREQFKLLAKTLRDLSKQLTQALGQIKASKARSDTPLIIPLKVPRAEIVSWLSMENKGGI